MNTHLLLASALRTLTMGVTLFAALRLLRIYQVRAQRAAWLLALGAALAMPVFISNGVGLRILPSFARHATAQQMLVPASVTYLPQAAQQTFSSSRQTPTVIIATAAPSEAPARRWPISYAATLYCLVAGFLLVRLASGLTLALRIRSQAQPAHRASGSDADIRISSRLATPVTIASSVVLPASSALWDEAKLRIVLSHERAHIRQHDFYIQLLASLNCAIFWFNPFSWWLQKHLSALGEAMSDLAALKQAESRTSYAAVLLEFATSAQWPLTGVAMARTSSLRVRVERLLNEQLFERSYTTRRRLPVLAAFLGIVAIGTSTSVIRVHAAQTAATAVPAGTSQPAASAADTTPAAISSGSEDPLNTGATATGASSHAARRAIAPTEHQTEVQEVSQETPATPPEALAAPAAPPAAQPGNHSNYTYAYNNNGDSYALVSGTGSYTFNGDWNQMGSVDTIRKGVHGDFIYYRHDGKSYVIDDPTMVARVKALYAPMEALGKQQEALGTQQQILGHQQEALARGQSVMKITNPDFTRELAAMQQAMQQLKKLQTEKEVGRVSLAELQAKIAEIQARLGALQGEAGEQQGNFGEEQGKLGEQQGKLGEEQGRLGEQQGKLGEEAHRQIIPMIQQAIQDGKARPVE